MKFPSIPRCFSDGPFLKDEPLTWELPWIHSSKPLLIDNLESRLELRRLVCLSSELEFDFATTVQERLILARRWAEARKGCFVLLLAMEILKREQESV